MIDIERLAREAGIDVVLHDISQPLVYEAEAKHMHRFAALVLEEAAKLAATESEANKFFKNYQAAFVLEDLAESIRALKEKK